MDKVLFVGLGRMGFKMASHAVGKGIEIYGFDIDQKKTQLFAQNGGLPANDLEKAIANVNVVCIMVGTEPEVREVVEKCMKHLPKDGVIILISTVSYELVQELAGRLEPLGLNLVEAPVCRAEVGAIQGNLLSLVVAFDHIFARVMPILQAWSGDIIHVSNESWGAAQTAKNVNDFILWTQIMAIEEGLELARAYNISAEKLISVLKKGSAESWIVRNWDAVGRMVWSKKDMDITMDLVQNSQLSLPLVDQIRDMVHTSNVLNHA
jgi:3-hydroxyisobutyrate dehydrogenase-like beta-hydroxyacid dehydrogenase